MEGDESTVFITIDGDKAWLMRLSQTVDRRRVRRGCAQNIRTYNNDTFVII